VKLTVTNHDRDSANFTYVYPVVSRRARGVSVGINLNPNNACNFRCIYCQVPDLIRGKAPPIDLPLLEAELRSLLGDVLHGSFMEDRVPEGSRRLNDLAFSGNGEPTSSRQFAECVELVGQVMRDFSLIGQAHLVLITNGSLTDRRHVEPALARMKELGGRVWFKLDSGTQSGAERINQNQGKLSERLARLDRVSRVCPTWVQTCMFKQGDQPPSSSECQAYLQALEGLLSRGALLRGVLLYGLARPSMQPEASQLSRLSDAWLEGFAEQIRGLGIGVEVSP
jgi:wyosine [tRNA(Phe)-imidazoG37] synthetase (radical SAM superfamily)